MQVIMIARLHAMYQRSRKILFCLVVIFLGVTIACGVLIGEMSSRVLGGKLLYSMKDFNSLDLIPEELVLSGTYECDDTIEGNAELLIAETWILVTVWEVLALSLAVWIVVKHFHELRRSSTGLTVRDGFTLLIKTHVLYFAA
jgi:preprotein translocase subunit SecG